MDDDAWALNQKVKAYLVFGIVFAVLVVGSFFDLLFLGFARETRAIVTEVNVTSASRGSKTIRVDYKYQEADGFERTGFTSSSQLGYVPDVGAEFDLQFLPRWLLDAPDASRPTRPFSFVMFLLMAAVCLGFGIFALYSIFSGEVQTTVPSRKRAR